MTRDVDQEPYDLFVEPEEVVLCLEMCQAEGVNLQQRHVVIRSLVLQTGAIDITTGLLRRIPLGAIRERILRGLHQDESLLDWKEGRVPQPRNPRPHRIVTAGRRPCSNEPGSFSPSG